MDKPSRRLSSMPQNMLRLKLHMFLSNLCLCFWYIVLLHYLLAYVLGLWLWLSISSFWCSLYWFLLLVRGFGSDSWFWLDDLDISLTNGLGFALNSYVSISSFLHVYHTSVNYSNRTQLSHILYIQRITFMSWYDIIIICNLIGHTSLCLLYPFSSFLFNTFIYYQPHDRKLAIHLFTPLFCHPFQMMDHHFIASYYTITITVYYSYTPFFLSFLRRYLHLINLCSVLVLSYMWTMFSCYHCCILKSHSY